MVRTTMPMSWVELKRSRFCNRCIGSAFGIAGLGVVLVQVLRIFFDLGSDRLFSSFFIKLGLPQLAVAVIAPLWHMPGIQFLWQLDYRYGNMLAFGLICIGALFWQLAKKKSQTMRDVNQRVQEESLKQERLGYPPGVPPQHNNIMNVTARDIHAPVIGAVDRSRLKINSTYNDLSAIGSLVNEMLAHIQELHLPQQQHMHLSAQLSAIQREITSHTPNHSRLRGALVEVGHTLRHLAEAGTAHVLVGHWREILHRL